MSPNGDAGHLTPSVYHVWF